MSLSDIELNLDVNARNLIWRGKIRGFQEMATISKFFTTRFHPHLSLTQKNNSNVEFNYTPSNKLHPHQGGTLEITMNLWGIDPELIEDFKLTVIKFDYYMMGYQSGQNMPPQVG